MKKLIIAVILILITVLYTRNVVLASQQHTEVTICHATGSQSNPYNKITVNDDAVNGIGNSDHNRSGHQNGEDIIPPGYWDLNGRNWDTEGQTIYNNNCNIPEPTVTPTNIPTPTEEPTATPTEEPTPTPTEEVTPTPTVEITPTPTKEPEVTPTETPRVTPTPTETVTETFTGLSSPTAFVCPDKDVVKVVANPQVKREGESATVSFFLTEGDKASIFYGEVGQPHWQYGVADIKPTAGDYVNFTIHGLNPDLGYDFGIEQMKGCAGGPITTVIVDGPTVQWFGFSYLEF